MQKNRDRQFIWHINSNRWNSAITEYAINLFQALELSGNSCIAVGQSEKPYLNRLLSLGHKSVFGLERISIFQIFKLWKWKKEYPPRLVVTFSGKEMNLMLLLKAIRFLKNVRIIRFYGSAFGTPEVEITRMLRRNLGLLSIERLFPSSFQAKRLSGKTSSQASIIPLAMPVERFHFSEPDFQQKDCIRLLILGRLDPVKGHREFLPIFKIIAEHYQGLGKKVSLTIVGLEENLTVQKIREASRNLLIQDKQIEFITKKVADLPRLLSTADVGVISSLGSEIICRVGIEFLCCGTPIFVSGVGSLNELLTDKEFGSSYENLSIEQAAKELIKLIDKSNSTGLRKTISNKAKEQFNLLKMGHDFVQLFDLN